MIHAVTLHQFKCFQEQTIPLGRLTLLAGLNGMGKSSVAQSLLLLRQSALERMLPGKGLLLNGALVRLGTAADVHYEGAQDDTLSLSLVTGEGTLTHRFSAAERDADVLKVLEGPAALPAEPLFDDRFQYLGAERIGPRDTYEVSSYHVREHGDMRADGAYGVAFLHTYADERDVPKALLHQGAESVKLRAQVGAWLGEVSPGVRLVTEVHRDFNRALLGVSFAKGRASSRSFRPTSVGFGLSYTLPVLLALLASPLGSLVVIENPEAHLHPKGQMIMGELLARAASAGVSVVVETHSDHVLNGVRLAIKRGLLPHGDVKLHYFERTEVDERLVHNVVSPAVDADGRIDIWPEGFFDQWDIALEALL